MKSNIKGNHPITGDYQAVNQLLDSEASFARYRQWIAELIYSKYSKFCEANSKGRILEFGAGTGNLSQKIERLARTEVSCIEIDERLQKIISERGLECFNSITSVKKSSLRFDFVFTSNVLEHIQDDTQALSELREVMSSKNSILVIYVPAHMWLFSELDKNVGHFRRYSKQEITNKVQAAGFEILEVEYADSLGILATLMIKCFGYKNSMGIGNSASMKLYDTLFHPLSKTLDWLGMKYLLGCNIILTAKCNS